MVVFLGAVLPRCSCALVGSIDTRQYASDLGEAPFNRMVRILGFKIKTEDGGKNLRIESLSMCTGQYVASDLILTAAHCIKSDGADVYYSIDPAKDGFGYKEGGAGLVSSESMGIDLSSYHFGDESVKNTWYFISHKDALVAKGEIDYKKVANSLDWALLRLPPDLVGAHSNDFFGVANADDVKLGVSGQSLGFGALRVLTDAEIPKIKAVFETVLKEIDEYKVEYADLIVEGYINKNNTIVAKVDALLEEKGIPPLFPDDEDEKLKFDTCKVVSFTDDDGYAFKTNCDTWQGNSGGAFIKSGDVYGVLSAGIRSFNDSDRGGNAWFSVASASYFASAKSFSDDVKKAKKKSSTGVVSKTDENTPSVTTENEETRTTEQDDSPQEEKSFVVTIEDVPKEEIEKKEQTVVEQLPDIPDMSYKEFFDFLGGDYADYVEVVKKRDKYRQEYQAAKDKEQSTANKLLGGATMAATGIGGMQLAEGLAQKAADEDAELDMAAYLATFRCNWNNATSVRGGEKNIQIPGSGDLAKLVTEYKELAADLKMRKEQLGMAPGIESEQIIDSATTGLYDDVGIGRGDGAYTSIADALSDPEGADAAEWAEQKDGASDKVKLGTGLVAGGAVAGAAGNLIINRDKNKKTDDAKKTNSASAGTVYK